MRRRTINGILVLAVCFLLAGCGFRLQGSFRLPPDLYTLHLTSFDRYSELTRVVQERLRRQDVTVIDQPAEAVPTLYLKSDRLYRRVLSLLENGQAAEYLLIYDVTYQLERPGLDPFLFSYQATRDYQDNPNQALGKSREVELLLREMRVQVADHIVRELARTDTLRPPQDPEGTLSTERQAEDPL